MLLSVDQSYGDEGTAQRIARLKEKMQIDWPSVLLPEGWNDAAKILNARGYNLIVVGPDGIVHGVDIRAHDLERVLKAALGETEAAEERDD